MHFGFEIDRLYCAQVKTLSNFDVIYCLNGRNNAPPKMTRASHLKFLKKQTFLIYFIEFFIQNRLKLFYSFFRL